MNAVQVEQAIQARGLRAPRVTSEYIASLIVSEHYFTARDGRRGALEAGSFTGREVPAVGDVNLRPLALLTFCVLVLQNGFTVTGESACVSPENFDAELGRDIARQNAVAKIWALEGYLLKERLSKQPQ